MGDMFGIGTAVSSLMSFFASLGTSIFNKNSVDATNIANLMATDATNLSNQQIQESVNLTNMSIQDSINEVNFAMNRETNDANLRIARETNAMQIAESEKAYQRSTASNQIAELVKAGYSYQQAKQIVAGSGSAAAYPPASLTAAQMVAPQAQAAQMQAAHMQAPTFQAYQANPSDFASAFGQLGNGVFSFAEDMMREDGGNIGFLTAKPFLDELCSHIDEFTPEELSSIQSLNTAVESKKDTPWLKDSWKKWERVKNNVSAQRACAKQAALYKASYSDNQQIRLGEITIKQEYIKSSILALEETSKTYQINIEKANAVCAQFNAQLAPFNFETAKAELNARLQQATLDGRYLSDPKYREHFVTNMLESQQMQALYQQCMIEQYTIQSMGNTEALQYMSDPTHAYMFGVYNLFKQFGMTDTDAGSVLALFTASGVDVSKLVNMILGKINDSVDTKGVISAPRNQFGKNALITHRTGAGAVSHGASW